jgi:peptidoglycan/LPS O-acetylase OafA/YrhL
MLSDRPHLAALTSLRFLTALHVFLFHIEAAHIAFTPNPIRLLSSVGYVGVNWFFVLSGFILTYSYAGKHFTLSSFWRGRFVRVYPAYFVSLCLAAPLFLYVCFYAPLTSEHSWIVVMRDHLFSFMFLALVLMQAWVPPAALSVNPVGWSLSVEAFFYFLFPLLLPLLAKCSRRALVFALVGLGFASLAMALAYVLRAPDGVAQLTPDMNHLPWLNALRFNPLVRLPEFLIGVCGGLLYLRRAAAHRWATPMVAAGLLVFLIATLYSDQIPYPVLHNGLLSLPFLAIIYGIALGPAWVGILAWRGFRMLGEISYSFFLTHGIVIALFFRPDGRRSPEHSILGILLCLALAIALAFVLYHGVEQAMRRRFSKPNASPENSVNTS